jgi:hypothetical protein
VVTPPSGSQSLAAFFRHRMAQNDWYPHQIDQILGSYDSPTISYLATINRSGFRAVDHHACASVSWWVAAYVDMSNYITRHIEPTCTCSMVEVAPEKIINIILKGEGPLISLRTQSNTGEILIHVEPRTPRSRYIAISHVWADGLGNPRANALPGCQLYQLRTRLNCLPRSRRDKAMAIGRFTADLTRLNFAISNSTHTPLFWIDTLCIPVGLQHMSLRAQSINQMASIYAGSVQVLVLDAELL